MTHLPPNAATDSGRSHHPRRVLARSILLGLCTTIAIAWAAALSDRTPEQQGSAYRDRRPTDGEGLGRIVVQWSTRPGLTRYDATVYPTCIAINGQSRPPEEVIPSWAVRRVLPWTVGSRPWPGSAAAPSTDSTQIIACGWPFPVLWRSHESGTAQSAVPTRAGFALSAAHLPIRPLWPALLMNTALFACVWWLLMAVPGLILTNARHLRGRCPACGYSLAGLSIPRAPRCPECGALRPAPIPRPVHAGA